MPFNRWMDENILVHPFNEILSTFINKLFIKIWINFKYIFLSKILISEKIHIIWLNFYNIQQKSKP